MLRGKHLSLIYFGITTTSSAINIACQYRNGIAIPEPFANSQKKRKKCLGILGLRNHLENGYTHSWRLVFLSVVMARPVHVKPFDVGFV